MQSLVFVSSTLPNRGEMEKPLPPTPLQPCRPRRSLTRHSLPEHRYTLYPAPKVPPLHADLLYEASRVAKCFHFDAIYSQNAVHSNQPVPASSCAWQSDRTGEPMFRYSVWSRKEQETTSRALVQFEGSLAMDYFDLTTLHQDAETLMDLVACRKR